ncbi:MAG: ATP-dependent DNA ligase [Methanomicrobiales archaeon]|nr:ATP-dependent DNA ligase [Methanomicrobiales archaeon]
MKFSTLIQYFEKLQATNSSNKMTAILADLLKIVDPEEIDSVCYFTLGRIGPDYSDVLLGLGENLVRSSIALAAGVDEEKLEKMKEVGDSGDLAVKADGPVQKKFENVFSFRDGLTVDDVKRGLSAIASASGSRSQETKVKILAAMIAGSTLPERRYLVRLATGQMRLGVGDMTLLDALAQAFLGSKRERGVLEHAYNINSDIGQVAKMLRTKGISGVRNTIIALNRPIRPMLAQRVRAITEILEKMPNTDIAAEEKFDGERIQAHKDGTSVRLFSRRLTDITAQFPDVVEQVREQVRASRVIIDGEAVAFDRDRDVYVPFQELMHRRRKYHVAEYVHRLPVHYMVFDLLWQDGKSFLESSYPDRRAALEGVIENGPLLAVTDRVVTRDITVIQGFFEACIRRGLEGVVCKSCARDSVYRAGSRDWQWIKWKTSYGTRVRDTFDLVIVGAFAGRGSRAGTYGSVLCAAFNPEEGVYQTVCRMGTGFSDEELTGMPARLAAALIATPPPHVMMTRQVQPDFYFSPQYVVEVLAAEITRSPIHTCGWDERLKRGFSLRFPRFVRWRPDKSPDQTTMVAEIIDLYRMQGVKGGEGRHTGAQQ